MMTKNLPGVPKLPENTEVNGTSTVQMKGILAPFSHSRTNPHLHLLTEVWYGIKPKLCIYCALSFK